MPEYTFNAEDETYTINALKIVLQVGGNSITIDTTGVTIKAMNVTIDADVQLQMQAVTLKEQISGLKDSSIALYKQA